MLFQVTESSCSHLWMDELVSCIFIFILFDFNAVSLPADPRQVLLMNWTIGSKVDFCQEERRKRFFALGTLPPVITWRTDLSTSPKQSV